jgi:hypothetical protein
MACIMVSRIDNAGRALAKVSQVVDSLMEEVSRSSETVEVGWSFDFPNLEDARLPRLARLTRLTRLSLVSFLLEHL